jgi:sterol desaturase/sphingolipid hydroxylase (fatty acid hydroxylase superfamily)
MLLIIGTFLVSLLISSFCGYWIHRGLHSRRLSFINKGHMEHHLQHYPPKRLVTDKYLRAKWFNSGPFLFTPPFVILLAVFGGLLWLLGLPMWCLAIFGPVMLAYGLFNDAVHDSFHVKNTWLRFLPFWTKLREHHFLHHHDMKRNFGIISFEWDRVFKTFKRL